jgi:endo-1,4-beta-xylanase
MTRHNFYLTGTSWRFRARDLLKVFFSLRNAAALVAVGAMGGCALVDEGPPSGDDLTENENGCAAGQSLCGTTCVSTQLDPLNCGVCGQACASGQSCVGGACVCGAGLSSCGSTCVLLGSDGANCGTCGNVCSDGLVCSLGTCSDTCAAELTQCGSSCVNVQQDPGNCGGCGQACSPGEVCSQGSCSCAFGQTQCGESCTDTTNDPAHCGACGLSCDSGASCQGSVCVGGDDGTGGTLLATGGAPSSGGTPGTGGVIATGGTVSTGGTLSTGGTGGGACTNVRPTGTMWDEATCAQWASETTECNNAWMVDNNYCNQSCGRCGSSGTGGTSSTGGSSGTGGGSGIPNTCTAANSQYCSNQIGTHCGYTFEYWKDNGSGCMTNQTDGFSVTWNNINNLLGRKGLRPGSANNIVTYQADYQPNGNSYLCVYGWTTSPLVEYYIVDSWGNWRPPGGSPMGQSISSDGGTYEIYRTLRENQPSIIGNATFYQYWSVRTQKRTSGTITVKNHFDAWGARGMNMGSLYEVSMTVEGYQSSGQANVKMHIQ